MTRNFLVLVLTILLVLSLTGCWDSQEPEKLAIVVAGAYDYNPETGLYKLILQIESSQAFQGSQGVGGSEKITYWTVSAWGYTPIDAIANIRKKVSREISYLHLHLLLLSEEIAKKEGVVTVMETLARTRQSRPINIIGVVKGDVEKMLSVDFPLEATNALGLLNQLTITNRELGTVSVENGKQFLNKLSLPGIEPVAVCLYLINEEREAEIEENKPPEVKLDGIAAFKKDKMAGRLIDREARGWNWIVSKRARAVLNLTYPENRDIYLTVVTKVAESEIEPVIKEGQPVINITVEVDGRVDSATGVVNFKEKSGLTDSLTNRLSEVVRNDIRKAVKKGQKLNCDVFGFGNAFYRLKYKQWQKYEDDWDKIFPDLEVNIDVRANILRTGMVNKGVKID